MAVPADPPAVTPAAFQTWAQDVSDTAQDHDTRLGAVEAAADTKRYVYSSGRYWGGIAATIINVAMTDGVLVVQPFPVDVEFTADRIGIRIDTAAASSVIRLGIYESAVDGRPGSLLLDAGTVDSATTGSKEITISQVLPPAVYWLGAAAQGGTPTTRHGTGAQVPIGDTSLANACGFVRGGYTESAVSAALPASFTGSGHSVEHPRVVVRAA